MEEFKKKDSLMKYFGTLDYEEAWAAKDRWEGPFSMDMISKIKLPYYAPGPHNPPLPIPDDIVNASRITTGLECQAFVRLLYGKYVIKFSRYACLLQEAENMLFLEQFPCIRIPKVYAVFEHQGADPLKHFVGKVPPPYYYIIMEYVEGDTLTTAWPKMSASEKEAINHQLGTTLHKLRSIPQPMEPNGPYYGRFGYQAFPREFQMVADHRGPVSGPYHTYEELVQQMAESAEMNLALSCNKPEYEYFSSEVDVLRRFKSSLLAASPDDRRPVITHLDLRPENLILRPRNRKTAPQEADEKVPYGTDYEIVFIDWETAGWLPAWADVNVIQDSSWHIDEAERDQYLGKLFEALGVSNMDIPNFLSECRRRIPYALVR